MTGIFRHIIKVIHRFINIVGSIFDARYISKDVPCAGDVSHAHWQEYLYQLANKPGWRILEIGSREVTGQSQARLRFNFASYTGFDIYPGANVDVTGDAHRLADYFLPGEQFDLIYSSACFEHLVMPWVVAQEIAKLLKVGGYVFIETHFSYSSHERPWHFYQFSDLALKSLFSGALGFECIQAGMSNPLVGRFSRLAAPTLRYKPVPGLYCHSEYLGRKIRHVADFDWRKADLTSIIGDTCYPQPDDK